jgi:prepilin-type N-terminal cleavage/methylation domain-containing protein
MLKTLRKSRGGFTLVEIMIVVAIIGLLAAIAVPSFLRARLRSQGTTILNDARMVDAAIDQYALETNKAGGAAVAWADLTPYLKAGSRLATSGNADILGRAYVISTVDAGVSVAAATQTDLSTACGSDGSFWGPFS